MQLATGCSGPRALVVAEDPSGATPDAKAGDWMAAVFTEVLQMGLRCMRDRPDDRPSLLEVIESLRAAEKAGAEGDGTLLATTAEIRRRHEEHERLKQALLAEQSKVRGRSRGHAGCGWCEAKHGGCGQRADRGWGGATQSMGGAAGFVCIANLRPSAHPSPRC